LENNRVFVKEEIQMNKQQELSSLKLQLKNAEERENKDKNDRIEVRKKIQAS
jgi:hypothetical protein